MKLSEDCLLLYAVTDRSWTQKKDLYSQVKEAIRGGVTCVQLREKELDEQSFLQEAIKIKELCEKNNVLFIINDNVDIAVKCQAHGVHIGQSDGDILDIRRKIGDNIILGVSVQSVEQGIEAQKKGADYLGVGTMFSTQTKKDAISVTIDTLKEICTTVNIPVVAIGGIQKDNILKLNNTGIKGVALVSAIFSKEDIENECKILNKLIKRCV